METLEDFGLPKEKLFFKVSEVVKLGIMGDSQAKLLIHKKKLQATRNGRTWLIPRTGLLAYLNENLNTKE